MLSMNFYVTVQQGFDSDLFFPELLPKSFNPSLLQVATGPQTSQQISLVKKKNRATAMC